MLCGKLESEFFRVLCKASCSCWVKPPVFTYGRTDDAIVSFFNARRAALFLYESGRELGASQLIVWYVGPALQFTQHGITYARGESNGECFSNNTLTF